MLQNISKGILICLLVTLAVVSWGASCPNPTYSKELPSKSELEKMEKMVAEICQEDDAALASKDMAASDYCEKMFEYARQAEEKSTKILLLRKAVKAAVKGEDLALVAKIYRTMVAKNGPYYVIEIFRPSMQFLKEKRYAADKGIAEIAKTLCKNIGTMEEKCDAIREVVKKYGDKPVDDKPRRQLVNAYMIIGDWARALELVAMGSGKTTTIAKAEQQYPDGEMPALSIGDYWWEQSEKSKQKSQAEAFAAHAATWYSIVLAESELSDLKRKLVEGRVKSVNKEFEVEGSDDEIANKNESAKSMTGNPGINKVRPGKEVWLIKTAEDGKGETWKGVNDREVSYDDYISMSTDKCKVKGLMNITLPAGRGYANELETCFRSWSDWPGQLIHLRKELYLPCDGSKIQECRIRYAVDDTLNVVVNGERIFRTDTHTGRQYRESIIDVSAFKKGKNIIAIRSWDAGRDRYHTLGYVDFGLCVKYK